MALTFGPFRLDPVERLLFRDGQPVDVQDQVIEVLAALTERPGGLWTREELHERLWPDAIVSEDALFQALAKARKALGDPARKPIYIATVPGQGYRFLAEVQVDEAPARRPLAAPPIERLPLPATELLGRADLVQRLEGELQQPGLWTLTGTGGMGKTRLALELASRHAHGAAFCDLQAATTTADVWGALGRTLHLTARVLDQPEEVAGQLAARGPVLLVLDNGEQVVEALAVVAVRLLGAAPEARLLVTSRIRLGVAAERLVELSPLALPPAGADLPTVAASPAGALLLQRAADLGVHPAPEQAAELAALTRALGGLPLAIELAAPRLRLLSPGQLLARMDRQLDLLGAQAADRPTRHHSLRSAIAASWELLEPELQQALAQLAVFPGPYSTEVAELALDPGLGDPLLALAELVDHSLVRRRLDRPDRPLLELLPSIRSFARAHLDEAGLQGMRGRIAAAYAQAAEHPGPEDLAAWQAGMERDSLLMALEHAQGEGNAPVAAALGRTLARTLLAHGPLHEVSGRLRPVRRMPGLGAVDRVRLLIVESEALLASTEVDAVGALLDEAEAILPAGSPLAASLARLRAARHFRRGELVEARAALGRGLADESLTATERARMLLLRGQVERAVVQPEAALASLEEARSLVEALDLRALRAELLFELGSAQMAFLSQELGRATLQASLECAREQQDPVGVARAQGLLGRALVHMGRRAEATAALDAAEPVLRQAGLMHEVGTLVESRAHVASAAGHPDQAAALLREAIALMEGAGQTRTASDARVSLIAALAVHGDLEEAEAMSLETLEHFRQQGRNPSVILHNLGEIHLRQGRLDESRQRLRAARLAHAAGGKPLSEALAWITLGEVELAAGDPAAAVPPTRKGVEILRKVARNDRLALGLAYLGYAQGLAGLGPEADASFAEALEVLADRVTTVRALVLAKHGLVAVHRGEADQARALRDQARDAAGEGAPIEILDVVHKLEEALG